MGNVEAHDIRLGEYFFNGCFFYLRIAKTGDVFVIGKNIGAKTAQYSGKGFARMAISNDANGLSAYFGSPVFGSAPQSAAHFTVCPANIIQQGQQHTQGVLGHRITQSFRSMNARNPFTLGIRHLYVFHARTYARYKF